MGIAILRRLALEGIVFWRNLTPHVGNSSHCFFSRKGI